MEMNRLLFLGICLWWMNFCHAALWGVQSDRMVRAARAYCPHLCWVEPGILSLTFSCPSSLDDLAGDDMLYISPVLIRPDGKQLTFSPVVYLTRSTKHFLERRLQYRPDPLWNGACFRVADNLSSSDLYLYQDTLAVGNDQGTRLEIRYYYANCCEEYYLTSDTLRVPAGGYTIRQLLPVPVLVNRIPLSPSSVVFSVPEGEQVKLREQIVTVPLHYRVNRTRVEEGYLDNSLHLMRLDSLCRPVFGAPSDYDVRSIRISGYASPEGDFDYNQRLSEQRAHGFADYVSSRYGISVSSIVSKGYGEDWDGLCRQVRADSLFVWKNEVLQIIEHYGIFEGREKRLMELAGGDAYRYMLRTYFPRLRRMELELNYRVRAFNPSEALQKLTTRPQDLDTYELYQAASLLAPDSLLSTAGGRMKYGRAFDLAASLHPDDVPTRLNAASAALLRYDLALAYHYLNTLTDRPEAWNNIGVYYWMCGDLQQARNFFVRALPHSSEAAANLNQLNVWEEEQR